MLQQHTKPKINVLVSYAYMRNYKETDTSWIFNIPGISILLDCGAYSAMNSGADIVLSDYIDYIKKWKHKLYGYVALDKIGDPKQTDINLNIMLKAGLKPIPVHVRGDGKSRMDELFRLNPLVALGGLKRPGRSSCSPSYVKQKMEWAAGRKVHWFGYTNLNMIAAFKPFSCDSSSITSSRRWGNTFFYKDQFTPSIVLSYDDFVKTKIPLWARERIEESGYTYEEMLQKKMWHGARQPASHIGNASYIRYAADMERIIGTKYFIVAVASCMQELFLSYHNVYNVPYCTKEHIPKSFT
jgi:hypothetical protein